MWKGSERDMAGFWMKCKRPDFWVMNCDDIVKNDYDVVSAS
jgi:hypothetical protein